MHLRTAAAVLGTVGGLALLLTFKTPGTAGSATSGAVAAAPPNTGTNGASATAAPPASRAGSPVPAAAATDGPSPSIARTGTATEKGPVVSTRYGNVQVEVDTSGGRITDVVALALPSDRRRSAEISNFAGPLLHDEVIQAQSAKIDTVSGATYTSDAYAQSVQAALDGHG